MYPYFIIFFLLLILPSKNINKLAFILLLLFLGIRYNIGFDFSGYYKLAENYKMFGFPLLNKSNFDTESLYFYNGIEFLNKILYQITWFFKKPQLIIFLYSFLELFFIKIGLDKKNIQNRFVWILMLSIPIFLFNYMSIMRQAVATSIIFYNYNNIIEKKYIKSFFFVIIATLFHSSALCCIFIYIISIFNLNLKKLLYMLIAFLTPLYVLFITETKISFIAKYHHYFVNYSRSGGGKVFYIILILTIILLIFYKKLKEKDIVLINNVLFGCLIYLNIYFLGDIVTRISLYYLILIFYMIEDIINLFKSKMIIKIFLTVSCFIFLFYTLYADKKNLKKLVPYKTFYSKLKY